MRHAIVAILFGVLALAPIRSKAAEISCLYSITANDLQGITADRASALEAEKSQYSAKRDLHPERRYDAWQKIVSTHPTGPLCGVALIKGRIEHGDAAKFSAFTRREPVLSAVSLWSKGGDLGEAIAIGQTIRDLSLKTDAPVAIAGKRHLIAPGRSVNDPVCSGDDCLCASACFVVWAGGVQRSGTALGLHRPSFDEQYLGSLSIHDAQDGWREVVAATKRYLQKMEVPDRYIDLMFSVEKQSLYVVGDHQTLVDYDGNGLTGHPFSIGEWLSANCDMPTKGEYRDFYDPMAGSEGYRKYLDQKVFRSEKCVGVLFGVARAETYLKGSASANR